MHITSRWTNVTHTQFENWRRSLGCGLATSYDKFTIFYFTSISSCKWLDGSHTTMCFGPEKKTLKFELRLVFFTSFCMLSVKWTHTRFCVVWMSQLRFTKKSIDAKVFSCLIELAATKSSYFCSVALKLFEMTLKVYFLPGKYLIKLVRQ